MPLPRGVAETHATIVPALYREFRCDLAHEELSRRSMSGFYFWSPPHKNVALASLGFTI